MTNTKFRKRALLSSVAMLLVALLALGSATFAWYQAQLSVTADGGTFTTSSASGLLIATYSGNGNAVPDDAGDFDTSATFNFSGSLKPVSLNPTDGLFYDVNGQGASNGAAQEGGTITARSTGYVLTDNIYFLIDPEGDGASADVILKGVNIEEALTTSTAAYAMAGGIRVAFFDKDGDLLYTNSGWADPTDGTDVEKAASAYEFSIAGGTDNYLVNSGTYAAATAPTKTVRAENLSGLTLPTGVTATTDVDDAVANFITVKVYLDGFATNVDTTHAKAIAAADAAVQDILKALHLSFTI